MIGGVARVITVQIVDGCGYLKENVYAGLPGKQRSLAVIPQLAGETTEGQQLVHQARRLLARGTRLGETDQPDDIRMAEARQHVNLAAKVRDKGISTRFRISILFTARLTAAAALSSVPSGGTARPLNTSPKAPLPIMPCGPSPAGATLKSLVHSRRLEYGKASGFSDDSSRKICQA